MSAPQRIQLRRSKGWRMPPDTVKVDRTSVFGNPFRVGNGRNAQQAVNAFRLWLTTDYLDVREPERKRRLLASLPALRGKSLACWCRPGAPCHADVLLEIANRGPEL